MHFEFQEAILVLLEDPFRECLCFCNLKFSFLGFIQPDPTKIVLQTFHDSVELFK